MTENKLIYIASPYAGEIEKNVAFAKSACRFAINQGYIPVAPHLLYPQMLNDSDPAEREIGLRLGHGVLEHCGELWCCGNRISHGMEQEISAAEKLGIPIRNFTHEQIMDEPAPVYTIWAEARRDGPLSGQAGFLCERRKRLYFPTEEAAAQKLRDLRNLCMNKEPAVSYRCVEYPGKHASLRNMQLETIREFDLAPDFDPQKFETRSQGYGNTGGNCMVGTVQFYLPDLDKPVWVNCNDEGVTITSADYVWNEDDSGSWERFEDVHLYEAQFEQELPNDAGPWLPMIKEALAYTIKQETAYWGHAFELPVVWLPDVCRQTAEPEYLAWLREQGGKAAIGVDGRILVESAYFQDNPSPLGMMTQQ